MVYSYRNKKTYRMKHKLKLLLTILLAVLISTTGYLLSKNVFSEFNHEYFNETTKDGINIRVVGHNNVIPDNSTIKIDKVSKEDKANVDNSINKVKDNNVNTLDSYTYDIKILDEDNNEIEPSEEIQIIFTDNKIKNKNLDTNIYHTSIDENNELTTEVLEGVKEGKTITTTTDSFSYYTVEFTYNNLQYSINGDSEVKLSTILEKVGLVGEVTSVEGSNDSLFSFEKRNNEWYVKANKAFSTTEWMKVTIDGIEYEIVVTDATNYTITYQSGNDGHFEGGATTNVVSYSKALGTITKYSHTSNVDDTGVQNGNYANNLDMNDVVTIPGASTLTVDIYYNGESVSYDWLSVWAGNYPNYTASSNITSTGYVTTDMGAPNNNNKFGGDQSESYIVNGNSLMFMGHCTLTIPGDSVTFGFKSDHSGTGMGYGYYAIVSGIGEVMTITSGEYKKPIPNDSEYRFKEWSQNPDTISTNTTVTASYEEDIFGKGVYDGVDWKLKGDGTLIIGKVGEIQSYTNNSSRDKSSWPWYQYRTEITSVRFDGIVNGNGSHSGMFYGCSSLISINMLNFYTSNIINMSSIFEKCSLLVNLDVSNFDTSNVTDMSSMFSDCDYITSLDLSNFDTGKVMNMRAMFNECDRLMNIDVSNFDTSKVTNMSFMFCACCLNLTNLNILNFNTSNVIDMSYMFAYSNNLTSFSLLNFDTTNVIEMDGMFKNCGALTSLDLSNFDTSNVTNMESMLENCSGLTILDLSNFDTNKVTDMDYMFRGCNNVITIYASNGWNVDGVTSSYSMFGNCINIIGENNTVFDSSYIDKSRAIFDEGISNPGYLTYKNHVFDQVAYAVFDSADGSLIFFKDEVSEYYNSQVIGTKTYYYNIDKNNVSKPPWHNRAISIKMVRVDDVISPVTTQSWFAGCWYLTTCDLAKLDTSMVTTMKGMFGDCSNLTTLDLSTFNTSNVIDMSGMFIRAGLNSLDISTFDTSNVINMSSMFYSCHISNLDLSSFDTSNVENMAHMFDTTFFTTLDLSNFDTSSVTDMQSMFACCYGLTDLNITSFDTSNVTTMYCMFHGSDDLTCLDLSNFNTSRVTNMDAMFQGCRSLTSLDLSSFDTSNVTTLRNMFGSCTNLVTIYVSNIWNMNAVTSSSNMFMEDTNLVGGQGTVYDANYIDVTRAIIDEGVSNPGYLTYKANIRKLSIYEEVKGSLADVNKNFTFNIYVQDNGVGINDTVAYTGSRSGNLEFVRGNSTFTLRHDEYIILNLNDGINYAITQNSDEYTLAKVNDNGTLNSNMTSVFTDTLNGSTPTGILFNLVPYILLLFGSILGILWIKKFAKI